MVVGPAAHVADRYGPAGLQSLAGGIGRIRWYPNVADDARLQPHTGDNQELAVRPVLQHLGHRRIAAAGGNRASLGEQGVERGFQQRCGGELGECCPLRKNPIERDLCPLPYGETAQKLSCRVIPKLRHR
jgi:hypothetical protein